MNRQQIKTIWFGRWRQLPWVRNTLIGIAPLAVIYLCQLITLQNSGDVLNWMDGHTEALFLTYGVLFFFQLFFLALTGRFFIAALATALPGVLFAVANHLKEVVNGAPILASDLAMAGQAGQIAGFLRPGMELGEGTWQAIWLLVLLLVLAFVYSKSSRKSHWPLRILVGGLALSLMMNIALLPASATLLAGQESESQGERNQRLGLLAGIYSALRSSAMEKPDAYSENNMNRILRELKELQVQPEGDGTPPHIVLLASESFFDVTRLPGLEFQENPIPNFHALKRQFGGGTFLSAAYAGGTGNVEMELFTSIPSAFPSASESLSSLSDRSAYSRAPSLIKALEGQGYSSVMVHSYNNSLYNRALTMPAIGFDEMVYDQDFIVPLQYSGGYISDDTLVDELIARFEQREEGPLFLYGLSMENHQPYYTGKFDQPLDIAYTCDDVTEDERGMLDALIHGIHNADAALGKLVDYFTQCEEPVLLVFLGDHLPGFHLDGGDTIYTQLGYVSSQNTEDWSSEELLKMHQTSFLVWNNFGAESEVPSQVSVTQMGGQILDWAGLWKPLWYQWVEQSKEDILLYRERLFVDGKGEPHEAPTAESAETVSVYRELVYDILYGEHYISDELTDYTPPTGD